MKFNFTRILCLLVCLNLFGLTVACQATASPATLPTENPYNLPEPTQIPTATAVTAVEGVPSASEMKAVIVNALFAMNLKPNRTQVTTVMKDGQTRTSTIEFVPPEKKYIVDDSEGVEYLVVGNQVFTKTKTAGKWELTKIPATTFLGTGQVTAKTIGETLSDFKWIGKQTLEGIPVDVYSYTSVSKVNDVELHNQTTIWIGQNDELPYKMIIDGEVLGVSTDSSTGATTYKAAQAVTTTLIHFDPSLQITPPAQ